MKKVIYTLLLAAGLIFTGIVIGVIMTPRLYIDNSVQAFPANRVVYLEAPARADSERAADSETVKPNRMFVRIARKVRPSIVSIYTLKNVTPGEQKKPFDAFGKAMPDDDIHRRPYKQRSMGSGIIISSDGYILTNNHVVAEMDEINVKLLDNRELRARLIGSDPKTDVALLKIDAKNLPLAVLGNSDNVEIGEWVMAIGSPLNLQATVTAGIVSAIGRNVDILANQGGDAIENFIQTDAAINPGNSGGALLNIYGEVIGINSAIATRTNFYMGYGFAIPVNIAKKIVDDLMRFGEVRRGYLGVYISPVTATVAKGSGLDIPHGVLVTNVIAGRAADKAGILEGDIILQVAKKDVNRTNELQARVSAYNPGEQIQIVLWRSGKKLTKNVTLLDSKGHIKRRALNVPRKTTQPKSEIGFDVQNLDKRTLKLFNIDGGVMISNVKPYTPASKARMRPGDVILYIDHHQVDDEAAFKRIMKNYQPGDVLSLKLRNNLGGNKNMDRLVFLEIPEDK